MAKTPYQLRIDEQAIGAGTTVRFALLVVLLLVSSASMITTAVRGLFGEHALGDFGCWFAAGADPLHSSEMAVIAHASAQRSAFEACTARFEPPPPWWVALGWPILVSAVAVALFWGLPAWKRRRSRVVLLAEIDHDGTISGELARLATSLAHLDRVPRFVVDPAAASSGAVVFGSNRRPIICLHGGLLARRVKDPKGFQAVVLHELAHVRNGDVTVTYLTVALWRVFLTLVLLPYLYWNISVLVIGRELFAWSIEAPGLTRGVLLTALMVVLIYLVRADVLRSREIYADLAAVGWGADRHGWAVPASQPDGGALRRVFGSFVELWRTHPRWDLRRASLTDIEQHGRDPAVLFGVQALPLFLTGAAAVLVDVQSSSTVVQYFRDIIWSPEVIPVGVAALVTAVAGRSLWRASAHSVLTGRPAPSGVRAGLWLGAGMAAAVLVTGDIATTQWLPSRPELLLLVTCAGVVFAWWSTQCAHLWLRAWPGRTIRPAILLGLAAGCLVLAGWFAWWDTHSPSYAIGLSSFEMAADAAGPGVDPNVILLASLAGMTSGLLVLPAVAVLWVVPLLVWTVGRVTALPRWSRVVRRRTGDTVAPVIGVPPLRRVVPAALLGGGFGWIALAGLMAYLHTTQPPSTPGTNVQVMDVYIPGIPVAWIAGMALAAVIASMMASRYHLLVALIASQTAGLVGFAGMFPLAAFDGCVPLLATLRGSCAWRPEMTWPLFSSFARPAFVAGVVTAVAAAAVVSVIQRLWGSGTWPVARAPLPPAGPRGQIVRRVGVATLCAITVGLSAANEIPLRRDDTPTPPRSPLPPWSTIVPNNPVSAQTRLYQVTAWDIYGGYDLAHRFLVAASGFLTLLDRSKGAVDGSLVHPFCVEFNQIARDADAYFKVPDPQAQSLWQTFIAEVRAAGQNCDRAVAQSNGDLLNRTADVLKQAAIADQAFTNRMSAVMRAGGG